MFKSIEPNKFWMNLYHPSLIYFYKTLTIVFSIKRVKFKNRRKKIRGHTDLNHGPIGLQPIALPLSYIPYMWLCGMSLPVLEPRLPKKCTVSDNQSESQVFSDSDAPSVHTNLHLLAASTVKLGDCRSKYVSSQLRGQLMSVCEWTWKSLSHLRSCLHR